MEQFYVVLGTVPRHMTLAMRPLVDTMLQLCSPSPAVIFPIGLTITAGRRGEGLFLGLHFEWKWAVIEKRKEKKSEAQEKEMMEEVQRAHHRSVYDENEEREEGEGKRKKWKTP